jgi:flagellar hook assembly protein FlgD
LLSTFNANDQIFIRFRLFADTYVTGWGWAIDDLEIQGRLVGVEDEKNNIPKAFALSQNYPNPFNPSTIISWQLAASSDVSVKVYDALGKEVATLINEKQNAGSHQIEFKAKGLASGIYYYRIKAGKFTETKKMILLR